MSKSYSSIHIVCGKKRYFFFLFFSNGSVFAFTLPAPTRRDLKYIERCASIIVESSRAINCICFVIVKRLYMATMFPFLAHERKMCRLERICHRAKKKTPASAYTFPLSKILKKSSFQLNAITLKL